MLLRLFGVKLVLLLAVFLVEPGIARVRRSWPIVRRDFLGMSERWTIGSASGIASRVRRTIGIVIGPGSIVIVAPISIASRVWRAIGIVIGPSSIVITAGIAITTPIGWRLVASAGFPCWNHSRAAEGSGTLRCGDGRPALIDGSAQFTIAARFLNVLVLGGNRGDVAFARKRFFFARRPLADAAIAAVVADAVFVAIDDGGVIDVVDFCDVHVGHGAVVIKVVALPSAAFIAVAEIAESIADAAVPTNVRAPIPFMEEKGAALPAPVAGRPEEADFRSFDPCPRNPVVVFVLGIPSPITWGPDVTVARAKRLLINW